MGQPKGLN